jgi:SAM-dependent methyltransferase
MQSNPQSHHFGADYDYSKGSPHLRHRHLYERLVADIAATIEPIRTAGSPVEVLEVGAGDGSVSERLLAMGCRVTATEMSPDSVAQMSSKFRGNENFTAVLDQEGDLDVLGDAEFDLILFASVLHHIPDYLSAIQIASDRHLRPHGSLVSIQDPPWYPRMKPRDRVISEAAFLSWRAAQGHLWRGLKTRLGRAVRGISEDAPGDTVEYHVVRNGVDEKRIETSLTGRFRDVRIEYYWSSQGHIQQRLGERFGLINTFALFADDRLQATGD